IPAGVLDQFQRAPAVERILQKLADARGFIRGLQGTSDPLFNECDLNGMLVELDGVYGDLKRAIPYAVCPYCQGKIFETCLNCKKGGVVSRFIWDTAVPSDLKEVRRRAIEDK